MKITSTSLWRRTAMALGGIAVGSWAMLAAAGATPDWGAVTGPSSAVRTPSSAEIGRAPLPSAGQAVGQWGLAGRASGGGGGPILATGYYMLTLNPTRLQGGGALPSSAHAAELGTRLTPQRLAARSAGRRQRDAQRLGQRYDRRRFRPAAAGDALAAGFRDGCHGGERQLQIEQRRRQERRRYVQPGRQRSVDDGTDGFER